MAETPSISETSLKQALTERLKATHVEVIDESGGCGQAFTCIIVSPEFTGLRVLARNRKVNTALKDEIAVIHAWTAKCKTPAEWAKETGASAAPDTAAFAT
ncbi:hypothetical protein MKZ38_006658 [Zalerion maritima]|uniref:BolA-like protein n=1 Tax=Zalerion maritima TaxID=339359 RepID=A0AAD5RWB9_9PEZI|nr:hypothetical protein MKZ38_006658 [Zalerion maritima]